MIKCEVKEQFYLGKFNELRNVIRFNLNKNKENELYVGDTFECTEEMAEYLTGKNALNRAFVKIIEVIPEVKKEPVKVEEEPIKPKRRRRKIEE